MSATVDERVVSMQFDNAQFERGVQQTLATLNNLNNSIEKNAAQNSVAFGGLVNSLNAMDNKISHGILPTMEVVNNKFSFMGTIADQTLRNITTSVENFIIKTVDGLFQVRGGMAEYELKMGSVQTILMGTGETLDTVTKKLDELNTYSDKTIYSFKDMTDNIGKFTNQGVKLDAAVDAIKGIANEAALSGANAMQASHAMYNFAQALSSGYVKLIDWKSIENSMMATVGFKDALLQTATAMGTVVKQGDKYITTTTNAQGKVSDLFNAQMGFNDSLQNQWLTNDVLTQTLEIYATDVRDLTAAEKEAYETKLKNIGMNEEQIKNFEQLGIKAADAATEIKTFSMLVDTITEAIGSGWAKTFEIIFGDFNEAKALWTGIGKYLGGLIDKFSDARNKMLETWKAAGGRTDLLQGLVNIGNAILSVFYPIRDAFRDVFGVMDSNALIGLTKGFAGFTQTLRLTNEQMGEVRGVMTVVFTLLKNGIEFVIRFRKEIIGLYLVVSFVTTLKSLLTGGLGLGSIYSVLKMIILLGIISYLFKIKDHLSGVMTMLNKISNSPFFTTIKKFASVTITLLLNGLKKIWNYLNSSEILSKVANRISGIGDLLKRLFNSSRISMADVKASMVQLKNVFQDITSWVKNGLAGILGFFTVTNTSAQTATNAVSKIQQPVKETTSLFDRMTTGVGDLLGCFNMVAYAAETTQNKVYNMDTHQFEDVVESTDDLSKNINEINTAVGKAETPLAGYVGSFQSWLSSLQDAIPAVKPLTDALSSISKSLLDLNPVAQSIISNVVGFVSKIKWDRVLPVTVLIAYVYYLKKLNSGVVSVGNEVNKFAAIFDNFFGGVGAGVKELLASFTATSVSITNFFNTLTSQYKKSNFKNTALGIFLLSASFVALTAALNYFDPSVLIGAAVALGVLSAAVLGINFAMVKLSQQVNPQGMFAIAAAFAIFAIAVTSVTASCIVLGLIIGGLSKIFNDTLTVFVALIAPLALLITITLTTVAIINVFAQALRGIGQDALAIIKGAGALIIMSAAIMSFAAAMVALTVAVNILVPLLAAFFGQLYLIFKAVSNGIVNIGEMVTSFGGFLSVLGTLVVSVVAIVAILAAFVAGVLAIGAALVVLTPLILVASADFLMLAAGISAVGGSLIIVSTAIALMKDKVAIAAQIIGELYAKVMLMNTLSKVVGFVGFAGILLVLKKTLDILAPSLAKAGTGMIKFAAGLVLFAMAVKVWSKMDPQKLLDGVLLMSLGMVVLARVLKMLDKVSIGKIAAGVIALVVAMYMLTPLVSLYGIAWKPMATGMLIVAGGMLAMAKAVQLMEKAQPGKVFMNALAMISAVVALGYVASLMASIFKEDTDAATAGVASVVALMLAFGVALNLAAESTEHSKSLSQFAIMVILMGTIVAGLTVAVGTLAQLPWEGLLAAAGALSVAMLSFSASIAIMAFASNLLNGANILGMAVLIGVFAASMSVLAISMSFLENLSWQQIIAFIGGFAGGLSILTVVLANFGAAASLAIPLLGAISVTMLSFGASALMVSLGVSAINLTFSLLLSTVTSFIPVLEQFITFLIAFSNKASDLLTMSESLTAIGQSLLWVAAGIGAVGAAAIIAAAGVALLSKAITAFSAALGVASVAINLFANSIRNLISVLGAPMKEAFTWGQHLSDNFAKGLSDGSGKVKIGATAVANAIKRILGHTSPLEGPLRGATEFLWGGHLTENIANGMEAGQGNVAGASADLGGTILSKLSEYIPGAQQIGNSIGDALGLGVKNTVKGHLMDVREAVNALKSNAPLSNETRKAAQESILNDIKNKDSKQMAHDLLNPIATDMIRNSDNPISKGIDKIYTDAKKKQTEDKNKWFDIKDFLPNVDDAIKKLGGNSTNTTPTIPDGGGGGTGKGKGGGGGASSAKDNAQAEKEAAEAARLHAQYMEYSTKAAKSYDMMYSGLNKTVGDTKPTEKAQEAIKLLSDYLYKSSLTGTESAEDLAKAAQNTEKAFVEMYDSIKKKTMESFDFFKEFSVDSSKILKADQILKNGQTQMMSQIEVAGMWQQLALKGVNTSQLIEMTKKGTDGIAEMRSMLMMTEDQFSKYQRMLKDTSAVADFEASQAMAASALSIQINNFKEDMKVRKERMDQYQELSMVWNNVQTDNVDLAMHAYSDIEKKLQELADKYHMTVDDLRAEAANYGNTVEDQANRQLEQYNRLTKAFYQWKDIYVTETANMKKAAEGFLNSFDKVELKTEKTADDLIQGLESRRDAYEEWIHDINDLVTQGVNQDIINQMIQKGVEGSYETVHALANASEDQIDEINELWGNMAAQSQNSAQEYGRTMATNAIVGMDATFGQYFQNLPINFNFGEFIANAKPQLDAVGQLFGNGLIDGIKAQDAAVQDSAKQVAEGADNTAAKYLNQETGFQKTAMYMVGMIEGIKKYKSSLMEEIEEVVDAIADLPAETWDIHSPSRLTKKYAYFFLRGFTDEFSEHGDDTINALSDNVLDPVVGCIRDALSTAYDILTTDGDFNPTITPVLDLSNINSGRRSLSSLMTSSGFQVEASLGNINTPSSKLDSLAKLLRGNVNAQNVGGNNYNFVQNNYSPKALSRLDIYRQTKNQFAQLKGMVN